MNGRLWLDAHEHPEYQGAGGLEWRGVVTRIRGIRLIYQPVTVYFAIPIRQEEPVDLRSTSSRRDPAMADRSFSEFLIDLETNPCSTHPPDKDKEAGPKADLF